MDALIQLSDVTKQYEDGRITPDAAEGSAA
jgi:hypothetical protein